MKILIMILSQILIIFLIIIIKINKEVIKVNEKILIIMKRNIKEIYLRNLNNLTLKIKNKNCIK